MSSGSTMLARGATMLGSSSGFDNTSGSGRDSSNIHGPIRGASHQNPQSNRWYGEVVQLVIHAANIICPFRSACHSRPVVHLILLGNPNQKSSGRRCPRTSDSLNSLHTRRDLMLRQRTRLLLLLQHVALAVPFFCMLLKGVSFQWLCGWVRCDVYVDHDFWVDRVWDLTHVARKRTGSSCHISSVFESRQGERIADRNSHELIAHTLRLNKNMMPLLMI